MATKDYALVNDNNEVVNTVVIDDEESDSTFASIAEANGAVAWYDFETYGTTAIGGSFYQGKLIMPKPFSSWILNETSYQWEAPVSRPDNELFYVWNEDTKSWDLIPASS